MEIAYKVVPVLVADLSWPLAGCSNAATLGIWDPLHRNRGAGQNDPQDDRFSGTSWIGGSRRTKTGLERIKILQESKKSEKRGPR